ncbi:hypothetical protein JTE90_011850 [Oedothorax gibbosus]|uniref:Uncharacterized protein n=1 Tax=Oedothorax gibbosus TaxID=931172 RepID=A0AAV6TIQ8_9ARAC|nr:hypothetical protein JTE90_011850 [Oedothorax gibbosus]
MPISPRSNPSGLAPRRVRYHGVRVLFAGHPSFIELGNSSPNLRGTRKRGVSVLALMFALSNSCVNPLVYGTTC